MCFVINNLKTLNAEKAFLFVDSMQYIFVKTIFLSGALNKSLRSFRPELYGTDVSVG